MLLLCYDTIQHLFCLILSTRKSLNQVERKIPACLVGGSNSAHSRHREEYTGGRRKGLPLKAYGRTLFDQYVARSVAAEAANSSAGISRSSSANWHFRWRCVFRAPAEGVPESGEDSSHFSCLFDRLFACSSEATRPRLTGKRTPTAMSWSLGES